MKKVFIIASMALGAIVCMSCESRSGKLREIKEAQELARYKAIEEAKLSGHNVFIRFSGKDSQIPKDGELLVVKVSLEDTVIVSPATDDDCRRILENHGKG